jgi:GNAT superfamily N-acetyltransferase
VQAPTDLSARYEIRPLSESALAAAHQLCEESTDFLSLPPEEFRRGTLGDSGYKPELAALVYPKSGESNNFADGLQPTPVAFAQLVVRRGYVLGRRAVIKAICVSRGTQRRGIGSWLLQYLLKAAKPLLGLLPTVSFGDSPPDYWFPGLDTRHTAAYFFLLKNGFKRRGERTNLTYPLGGFPANAPPTEINGYRIERVSEVTAQAARDFVKKNFGLGTWAEEFWLSLANEPPTSFITLGPGPSPEVVGFATHSAQFPGSFGPTGVLKSLRGKGVGSLLLKWTFWDLQQRGATAVTILWVVGNTVKFYSKALGAVMHPIMYVMRRRI